MFLVVLSQKEIHDRACQMTQGKQHGKHHGKEIFPVPGECKKSRAGKQAQRQNKRRACIPAVIEHPAEKIAAAEGRGQPKGFFSGKGGFRRAILKGAQGNRQKHLKTGGRQIPAGRMGFRPQDIPGCGNGKPKYVGQHDQKKQAKPPEVKSEAKAFFSCHCHFSFLTQAREYRSA